MPESFANALQATREALSRDGLSIVGEFDVSNRVTQTLGIRLPPCRILYVWPSPTTVERMLLTAAVFLPLHVVLAEQGRRTDVSVRRHFDEAHDHVDAAVREAVTRTQTGAVRCLRNVCVRASLV
jgi:uncharacterized protein (DUF302 family)